MTYTQGMRILGALFFILILASCQPRTVTIGLVSGLTGPNSELGVAGRNGALMAVEDFNKDSQTRGFRFALKVWDDQSDPASVKTGLEYFHAEGIRLVVGPFISAIADEAVLTAREKDLFLLSPTVSATVFQSVDDPMFRLVPSVEAEAVSLARALLDLPDTQSVAVLYDFGNNAYSNSFTQAFFDVWVPSGRKRASTVGVDATAPIPWNEVLPVVVEESPDAVLFITSGAVAAVAAQGLRASGYDGRFLISGWTATGDFIGMGNGAFEGALLAQFFTLFNQSPGLRRFRVRYIERFGSEPSFSSLYSYDAVTILEKALQMNAAYLGVEDFKNRVRRLGELDLLKGRLRFNEFGDVEAFAHIFIVENQELRLFHRSE